MAVLVPLAQEEEKERNRKRDEEQKAEREETERLKEEAERRKKQEEEREEQQRLQAEAEAAAAAQARGQQDEVEGREDEGDTDPMEEVQGTDATTAPEIAENAASASTEAESRPRVFTTIRGRQLDISGLDIDIEYLEALPEELREEVIMQQYATRREEARQEGKRRIDGH